MDDLIKALQILRKYGNPGNPTHCEHDTLLVLIDPISCQRERFGRTAGTRFQSNQ